MITTPVSRFHRPEIITESDYSSKEADRFKGLECPNCHEIGGLFMGFFSLQCKHCMGLFLRDKDVAKGVIVIN